MNNEDEVRKCLNNVLSSGVTFKDNIWRVMPGSTREVAEIMSIATKYGCNVTLVPEGFEGDIIATTKPLIAVSMEKMNEITTINEDSLFVDVHSGISVKNFEMILNEYGFTSGFILVPDVNPSVIDYFLEETLSELSMYYGGRFDSIIEIKGVLPDGKIFQLSSARRLAPFSTPLKLMILNHGVLCIITAMKIRIWRQAKARRIIGVKFNAIENVVRWGASIAESGIRPAALRVYIGLLADKNFNDRRWDGNLAVISLEGEELIVDVYARYLEKITNENNGILIESPHPFVTKNVGKSIEGFEKDCKTIVLMTSWRDLLDIIKILLDRFGEIIAVFRLSDFFPEGCKLWLMIYKSFVTDEFLSDFYTTIRKFEAVAIPGWRIKKEGSRGKYMKKLKEFFDPENVILPVDFFMPEYP